MISVLLFVFALCPLALQAGDGKDAPGTVQAPPPAHLEIPDAPVLAPAEALAAFEVDEGFEIQLVVGEPLVGDPVVATFAPDGSLWVVEMRGYMPDADGTGEHEPNGVVAVLHDDDGDGHHERRVEFLSDLVLPRGVLPTRGGALVLAPPNLLFCRDTDGDGRADERTVVDTGLAGLDNPEHAVNGLLATLDNAVACANHSRRYRWSDTEERFLIEPTSGGGQWGITQDDWGRIFFNTNSAALRTDAVPSRYGVRNPNHGDVPGTNEGCVDDTRVWPVRITTGVNRGYQKGLLDDQGRLTHLTAACGPHIDRSGTLPATYAGSAFVCEPSGNLVKRYVLQDDDGDEHVRGKLADVGREFLASHDERFRPVHAFGGPDGAVYLVDMYRGIIQHRIYMTTFLRRQVDERELATPIGLGRIWRIAPAGHVPTRAPNIAAATDAELIETLGHTNGWWRDAAQRTLVERPYLTASTADALRALAVGDDAALLARTHAVWTLAGHGPLEASFAASLVATADTDPRWAIQVLRAVEPTLGVLPAPRPLAPRPPLVEALRRLARASYATPTVLRQLAFTAGAARDDVAFSLMSTLLEQGRVETTAMRSAVASGLRDREVRFLTRLAKSPAWRTESAGRAKLFELLARATTRTRRTEDIDTALALVIDARPWQQHALLDGILAAREKRGENDVPIALAHPPSALDALTSIGDSAVFAHVLDVVSWLTWPGRPPRPGTPPPPRALTEAERASFERGRTTFASTCATCHQHSGLGQAGLAPRLRNSEWALGDAETLARIVLHGLEGEIDIDGVRWNMLMPSLPLPDADIADVLTYVRREWGHGAEPIAPDVVTRVRATAGERSDPWTVDELRTTTASH